MHKNAEFQNCLNPMVKINQCVLWDNMQYENSEFLGMKQHLTVQNLDKMISLHSCVMLQIDLMLI